MVWGCVASQGLGPIKRSMDKMTKEVYKYILNTTMLPYVDREMTPLWTFQHENDPSISSSEILA